MSDLIALDIETARTNPYSYKWGSIVNDCIPMDVADMDFKAPNFIVNAMQKYMHTGMYGYFKTNPDFYAAIDSWFSRSLNLKLDIDSIIPTTGVLASLRAIIHGYTNLNDKILIQEPVYFGFKKVILQMHRSVVINQLQLNDNGYFIDFNKLEDQFKEGVKIFILCSPHNPIGKVWSEETIIALAELCQKYNVFLVSDEIHADLCMPNQKFYSACQLPAHLTENCLILNSPSKAFNISGLRGGYIIVPNKNLVPTVKDHLLIFAADKPNSIFITATTSAYTHGFKWLQELLTYTNNNYMFLTEYLKANAPYLRVCDLQATYLVWIDYSAMNIPEQTLITALSDKVTVVPGSAFGNSGDNFFRITIACPKNILQEALERIVSICNALVYQDIF